MCPRDGLERAARRTGWRMTDPAILKRRARKTAWAAGQAAVGDAKAGNAEAGWPGGWQPRAAATTPACVEGTKNRTRGGHGRKKTRAPATRVFHQAWIAKVPAGGDGAEANVVRQGRVDLTIFRCTDAWFNSNQEWCVMADIQSSMDPARTKDRMSQASACGKANAPQKSFVRRAMP